MEIKLIDYVQDAEVKDGAIFHGMVVRVVGKDVLFDFAGMNPCAAKSFGGPVIADDEILLNKDTDSVDKDTLNHELNEHFILLEHPDWCYWDVHTALQKTTKEPAHNLSINRVEVKAMKSIRKSMPITIRKNVNGMEEIVINSGNPDRCGDRVFPEGVDVTDWLKNPVVMWLHDYQGKTPAAGIPLGKGSYINATEEGLVAGPIKWLEGDAFVDRVKNAWNQGVLKAASIGFDPTESKPNDQGGVDYLKCKLLEYSIVPIPMDADALRIAKSAGFEDLISKHLSQGEIKDELDYALSIIKTGNISAGNESLVKSIRDEVLKRYPASDMAVEDKSNSIVKAIFAKNKT